MVRVRWCNLRLKDVHGVCGFIKTICQWKVDIGSRFVESVCNWEICLDSVDSLELLYSCTFGIHKIREQGLLYREGIYKTTSCVQAMKVMIFLLKTMTNPFSVSCVHIVIWLLMHLSVKLLAEFILWNSFDCICPMMIMLKFCMRMSPTIWSLFTFFVILPEFFF